MTKPGYLSALEVLKAHSEGAFGVEYPTELLQREMGIGRTQACLHLRELVKRQLIVTDSTGIQGSLITHAYLRDGTSTKGPSTDDIESRLIGSLRQRAREVSLGPVGTATVVDAVSFMAIHREANIVQTYFYDLLRRFEKRGWLKIIYKPGRNRYRGTTISSVWLLPTFPSPTPSS